MDRPDPDLLLQELHEEEKATQGGRLKIFFGFAAGVGKTYAMLEAARAAQRAGIDVLAGYIEPHTRPETMALLEGLPAMPALEVPYRGVTLREFDLDGALARHPQLILVDELAHTNAESCRHRKRYQDVEELLRAGIDVYTTVNVQHIESLNDIVASITGVTVRERVPDSVFDKADQVELVDIEPDELIERLGAGKIYREQQAHRALGNFFTAENLAALREIALRRTADRVGGREKTSEKKAKRDYFTEEHILICLSSSPSNAKVIRTAARFASAFHGRFTALFVETPGTTELANGNRENLRANLRLAEQLGARIDTVYGDDIPAQIAEYARASGVSKIVLGRSNSKKSLISTRQTLVERLTALAPNLDIYIIPDHRDPYDAPRSARQWRLPSFSWSDTAKAAAILAICSAIGLVFYHFGFTEANIITVYILGVLTTSMVTSGRVFSLAASFVSVFAFNFFFTVPRFSFQAYDASYFFTFPFMFVAALLTSTLAARVKNQARISSLKAYRTGVMLETSQKLQRAPDRATLLREGAQQVMRLMERTVVLYTVEEQHLGEPAVYLAPGAAEEEGARCTTPDERAVASWVYQNNKRAGATTDTLPGAKCLYMAVRGQGRVYAVVGIVMEGSPAPDAFDRNLLVSLLGEFALALEKERLGEANHQIAMQAKQEQLRANLLRAISHDLRTPLTSISGNAGLLMESADALDAERRSELYADIYDDSMWLINLVENLLSVTRIENGTMQLKLEPESLDDVIAEAMRHIDRRASEHNIATSLESDLLMARMDARLIVQVIINIVDNAVKYTPPGSHITVSAKREGPMVLVSIADDGPGVPDPAKGPLFDLFFTVENSRGDGRRGLGLGLSLCRSIVAAHGGMIRITDNTPHGAVFSFTLPAQEVECQ